MKHPHNPEGDYYIRLSSSQQLGAAVTASRCSSGGVDWAAARQFDRRRGGLGSWWSETTESTVVKGAAGQWAAREGATAEAGGLCGGRNRAQRRHGGECPVKINGAGREAAEQESVFAGLHGDGDGMGSPAESTARLGYLVSRDEHGAARRLKRFGYDCVNWNCRRSNMYKE
ncbi:hypothetical protein M0R45_019605 [Rubus argutus]|uniref:Uncharacterized protein n=1 Tax=Rubus argutus TaxID=59490 RepID=A0AAW1X7G3_RUBAR